MTNPADQAALCPICGGDNRCGNVAGEARGACWCVMEHFPQELFDLVPDDLLRKSCICKTCLERFKNAGQPDR